MYQIIVFWNDTLHVSDGLSVRHQEFKTVHTATDICQTDRNNDATGWFYNRRIYGTLPKFNWRDQRNPRQICQYSRSVNRYFGARPTRVWRYGVRIQVGVRKCFSSPKKRPDRLWDSPSLLLDVYSVLYRKSSVRGVMLTTYHIVSRLRWVELYLCFS